MFVLSFLLVCRCWLCLLFQSLFLGGKKVVRYRTRSGSLFFPPPSAELRALFLAVQSQGLSSWKLILGLLAAFVYLVPISCTNFANLGSQVTSWEATKKWNYDQIKTMSHVLGVQEICWKQVKKGCQDQWRSTFQKMTITWNLIFLQVWTPLRSSNNLPLNAFSWQPWFGLSTSNFFNEISHQMWPFRSKPLQGIDPVDSGIARWMISF